MREIVLLSLVAALNPTLLTATTVMLLLPSPSRLMLGYWLGAMLTSVTAGLVIVFTLKGSSAVSTSKKSVSPAIDLAFGLILLIVALVLATGRDAPLRERRAEHRADKRPPRWQKQLSKGTARATFVIGVLLSFPGASYLAALTRLSKLGYSTLDTVLVVIGFSLVQLTLLEAPMLAFRVAPRWTPAAIERLKAWGRAHGRSYGAAALATLGALLVIRAVIELA
jgi:hypothetical protein